MLSPTATIKKPGTTSQTDASVRILFQTYICYGKENYSYSTIKSSIDLLHLNL